MDKRIDTRCGGILVLEKGEARCALAIERHAVIPLTPGWAATYYGPDDVEAERIKRLREWPAAGYDAG